MAGDQPTDAELIAAAVAGDAEAFCLIYDRYAAPLAGWHARSVWTSMSSRSRGAYPRRRQVSRAHAHGDRPGRRLDLPVAGAPERGPRERRESRAAADPSARALPGLSL
jgi:hypothetical protein